MSDRPERAGRSLADATVARETPVTSREARCRVEPVLDHVDAEVVSTPNGADTTRALNRLATEPAVEAAREWARRFPPGVGTAPAHRAPGSRVPPRYEENISSKRSLDVKE